MAPAGTEGSRVNRRREQNRLAQRRFREKKRQQTEDGNDSNDTSNSTSKKRQMRSIKKNIQHDLQSPSYQLENDDCAKDREYSLVSPTTQLSFRTGDIFGEQAGLQSSSPADSGTYDPDDIFMFEDLHMNSQMEMDNPMQQDFSATEFGLQSTRMDGFPIGVQGFTPVEPAYQGFMGDKYEKQPFKKERGSSERSYEYNAESFNLEGPRVTSPTLQPPQGALSPEHAHDYLEDGLMKHFSRYNPRTFTDALLLPLTRKVLLKSQNRR